MPDDQIFDQRREILNSILLAKRLRELAFLNPGLRIHLKEDKNDREENFFLKMVLANMCPI